MAQVSPLRSRLRAVVLVACAGATVCCSARIPAPPLATDAATGSGDATAVDRFVAPDVIAAADAPPLSGSDAACATETASAEPVPLDLYVMMDSSRSMLESSGGGTTKWAAVTGALGAFFNDPQSAGIAVGIRYFPEVQPGVPATCTVDAGCAGFGPCDLRRSCVRTGTTTTAVTLCQDAAGCAANETCALLGTCPVAGGYCAPAGSAACNGGEICKAIDGYCHGRDICDTAPYATPAVAIAALPAAAAALTSSLNGHAPDGFTPTGPALAGALQHARARALANPSHKVAALLVTDGLPSECAPSDIPGIAALARAGAAGPPSIPTFVIGVFSPAESATAGTNLNALAQAGGTGSAVVISTSQNVTQALQTALNQIRTKAIACEYQIPPATTGAIDFGKVNVQFTSGGGTVTTIGRASASTTCDPVRGGWYYDVDPSSGGRPASIKACEATCAQLQGDQAGRVDIVLGCVTITIT